MLLLDMLTSKTVATRARTRLTARDSFLDVESIHDRTHIGKVGRIPYGIILCSFRGEALFCTRLLQRGATR